ncbi:MLO-like protein 6 isoform X2 [Hevea brasiliensis]|uniref:MLO-like protein 6 isoform X2 n=1 Tax=Hevea brasiliensis TaxID=3981 RepID=UPI0025CC40A1|nr:MLO-like protein 6 isoform X2 [Hevea brasiliensis]
MAGGGGGRSLEQTPTWAVAIVCFVLVLVSIIIEYIIHLIGKWLKKKHKRALYEALEKVKSELMLLGFISLLLTVGQGPISNICIPEKVGSSWHPCSKEEEANINKAEVPATENENRRKLLTISDSGGSLHRVLAGTTTTDKCGEMRRWKSWEKETRTAEYQFSHDPERFRFARETSFGRRHLSFWTKTPVLIWIVCFFRQFVRSVPKVDYLTLRHGFIMAHLAPQSHMKFDFQKYINRSLEEDFKVVVGISPPIWFFAVVFLLFNTHGWHSYLWLPFIPLIIILLVGTQLQVIITKMALRIQERGEVVKGVPVVQPGDDLFWFNRPRLILYLINFVLFQNAFQLAFFAWSWKEFGIKSCFHAHVEDIVIRISMGVLVQILCSYVTLPLYALVTQMGSSMKPTIFNERVAAALRNWHKTAKKNIKRNKGSVTPLSSRPATPSHHMSPVHLLRYYQNEMDSLQNSPRRSSLNRCETDSPSPSHPNHGEGSSSTHHLNHGDGSSSSHHHHHQQVELSYVECKREGNEEPSSSQVAPVPEHEINIVPREFSFDKRASV